MIFDNYATQAAEASLDALWLKTRAISNNLANIDTPGFKQTHVSFEEVLRKSRSGQNAGGQSSREASRESSGAVYRTTITQEDNRSVRTDSNNVQYEQQSLELWKAQAQYSYLIDRLSGHYSSLNAVMNNMK